MIKIQHLIAFYLVFALSVSCSNEKKTSNEDTSNETGTASNDFVSIFDGKTLNNWMSDSIHWSVENGCIVGRVTEETPLEANNFLIWQGEDLKDFELITEFKITESGNSGIQYRSDLVEGVPYGLRGYQADIDGRNNYTGQNYEERKRTTLAYRGQEVVVKGAPDPNAPVRDNVSKNAWQSTDIVNSLGDSDELKTKIHAGDWNECRLVIKGNHLQHYINGVLMSDVTDNDEVNRKFSGLLGFQIHKGPPMQVEYRNVQLKKL